LSDNANRKPSDFDWIAVRGNCSIRQMFEELRLGITQDVEAINEQTRPNNPHSVFKMVGDKKLIKVFEDDPYQDGGPSILFVLADNAISVRDGETNRPIFDISISLNDEGECRFVVDGKERDSWQIRRKALEGMFFRA
jgi:hypothetical protein